MARGGSRNRSGPQADPNSGRSDRRGYSLTALPAEGFDGEAPALDSFLLVTTDRHSAIWAQLWTTPQACAWSLEAWRWPIVADLVKWSVRSDDDEAAASIATTIRQLRDDLGLSAAGLKANGWKIATEPALEAVVDAPAEAVTDIRSRLNRGSA